VTCHDRSCGWQYTQYCIHCRHLWFFAYLYVFARVDLVDVPDEAQAAVPMLAEHILSS